MGYTTSFYGAFELNKPLTKEDSEWLKKFSGTRRMKRALCEKKYGFEGEWFVDGLGAFDQDDDSVLNHNKEPETQPGLWCQWVPTDDNKAIEWDGGEKFYHAEDWIAYLVEGFFKPKGYVLNGTVDAEGEESGDMWQIRIEDNVVYRYQGSVVYGDACQIKVSDKMIPIDKLEKDVECDTCEEKIKCELNMKKSTITV